MHIYEQKLTVMYQCILPFFFLILTVLSSLDTLEEIMIDLIYNIVEAYVLLNKLKYNYS